MTKSRYGKGRETLGKELKFQLTTVLLTHGQSDLASHLGISSTELSKKINGENGWKLEQIAAALEFVGAKIVPADHEIVVLPKDYFDALKTLAKKSLENE